MSTIDRHPEWGYAREVYDSPRTYLSYIITAFFGKQNTRSRSADWGGVPNWIVAGEEQDGIFITITDNDTVVLLRRINNGDETIDKNLRTATNGNELQHLLKVAEYLQASF